MSDDPNEAEIALEVWSTALEVYRHHFELYLKAVALYFAIMGAAAGFVFKPNMPQGSKLGISFLITCFSFVAFLGSHFSHRWAREFSKYIVPFESRLRIAPFPISGALRITRLFMWTALLITLLSAINSVFLGI